jgi:hypothetical protein
MAFTIPMFVGGLAAYVQKKTEKPYFFEQTIGGVVGYSIGLIRILAAQNTYVTNHHAVVALATPALITGMGWGIGRITGGLIGDARN